ncbi:hypothetical protein V2W30_00595 [Streptomyces sp. Q6]|uniref:Uncharacterized protein n=1 Tax=Streptomyces citrinus TaxID=3118173 RepID=A0ACD5A4T8_9ACTN
MRTGAGRERLRGWLRRRRERSTAAAVEDAIPGGIAQATVLVSDAIHRGKGPRDTPSPVPRTRVGGDGVHGGRLHRLKMPSYRPAVLFFSTAATAQLNVRFENRRKERSSRMYRLSGDGAPFTARIPLPGAIKTVDFRVFAIGARAAWTATAVPLREIPRFHHECNGTGSDVVHYRGGPGPGVLHYAGPSQIQLEALDDHLAYRLTVTEGRAGERTFQWPGRGYYQVRSAGAWSLTAL